MDTKLSFGRWVQQRRKALALTQHELAHQMGCTLSMLQKIERNARQPSRQMAELLAHHLELDLSERDAFLQLACHRPTPAPPILTIALSARRPFTNLPSPLSSLVGREWEVATLCARLLEENVRLLTITGPPGIGKTRLALRVAQTMMEYGIQRVECGIGVETSNPTLDSVFRPPPFGDGVCFVALAPIGDARFVIAAIARALGVEDTGGQPLVERVKASLHDRHCLLVLDNFEHVLPAAPLVVELLEAVSHLKILVTSRAALQVYGEHEFVVSPLALPDLNRLPAPAQLLHYAAVELFVQRARAVQPEFTLDASNAEVVAEICVRLDGLPLALELAAARSKLFSPQTLLAHLTGAVASQLDLLTGAQYLPARHRTLRNAIAWSYDLLNVTEQTVFRGLGVFAGGCILEAASSVIRSQLAVTSEQSARIIESWLLITLQSLVNHSLVLQQQEADGEPRFTLLELLRDYALEQLEAHGEAEAARYAHGVYFLQLAQKYQSAHMEGRGRTPGLFLRTERELDNLRAALQWASRHHPELEVQLTTAMTGFWSSRRYLDEGRQWLEGLLPRLKADLPQFTPPQLTQYASLVALLAFFTWQQGDPVLAQTRFAESIALWQHLQNRLELGMALQFQALICFNQGDYRLARPLAEESVAILRTIDESWQLAIALKNLGRIQLVLGDALAARRLIEESIAIMQAWGNTWGISNGLLALSEVTFTQGDYSSACSCLEQALHYYQATNETWFLAQTLLAMGKVVWRQGNRPQATVYWEESSLLAREAGAKLFLSEALLMLGLAAQESGDPQCAKTFFMESLALFQAMGNKAGVAYALSGLVGGLDQPERAAIALGAVAIVLDTTRLPMDQIERAHYERSVSAVRTQLEEVIFAAAWIEGQATSLEQAVALSSA